MWLRGSAHKLRSARCSRARTLPSDGRHSTPIVCVNPSLVQGLDIS